MKSSFKCHLLIVEPEQITFSDPGGSDDKESAHVQSLGWEDLLEKGLATHSSILSWRIPWTEQSGGLQFMALQRVMHD